MLVLHWFSNWLVHRKESITSPVSGLSQGLVELAYATNQMWQSEFDHSLDQLDLPDASANGDLFEREAILSSLRRLQDTMVNQGIETEIMEDLQGFLAGINGSENIRFLNQYLSALVEWMKPFIEEDSRISLERLALHPDRAGGLPVLAFELSGNPAEIARSVNSADWNVMELDFVGGEGIDWWIRGSCEWPRQDIH